MKVTSAAFFVLAGAPALAQPHVAGGKHFFDAPFPNGNGRACATCHIEGDHFALTPEHVADLPPDDPLFRRIDADDPAAANPTYDHVRAGLIRVVLPLAPNLDVIDLMGNVITNPERTITVWCGVPSIENTELTGCRRIERCCSRPPVFVRSCASSARCGRSIAPVATPPSTPRTASSTWSAPTPAASCSRRARSARP